MQLAPPVSGTLHVRAGRHVYIVLLTFGTLFLVPSFYVALRSSGFWIPVGIITIAVVFALRWLSRLDVELTNESITYRTLWGTKTLLLTDLERAVVEIGSHPSRPFVRLVLTPFGRTDQKRIDVPIKQLDEESLRQLLIHLGLSPTSHRVVHVPRIGQRK
jgi:hypothetical protein